MCVCKIDNSADVVFVYIRLVTVLVWCYAYLSKTDNSVGVVLHVSVKYWQQCLCGVTCICIGLVTVLVWCYTSVQDL